MINKKKLKNLINLILEDYKYCKKIYKESIFWKTASNKLLKYIINNGIKNFKNYNVCNSFFVPVYNFKKQILTNSHLKLQKSSSKKFIGYYKNLVSGYNQAISDYRVFKASDNHDRYPYLHNFSETKFGNPLEQFNFENKKFSRSTLNYILGLVFFKKYAKNFVPKKILEIGGGYGSLGEIYAFSAVKNFKYINVDLPAQTLITELYLSRLFGSYKVSSYLKTRELKKIKINKLKKFTSLVTWQIEKLEGKIDLFVNFISFQEMEPNIVKNYLGIISKLKPKYILLRNLREGKPRIKKNKIGVNKPTKKVDYIKFLKHEYYLLKSNVVPFGYKTYDNFNSELLLFKRFN